MTRRTIAATVRSIEFRIRADWDNPGCPVEIESEDGFGWHDTGDTVGDWTPADLDAPRLDGRGFSSTAAAAAIAGVVQSCFDHPRWMSLSDRDVIAAATVED